MTLKTANQFSCMTLAHDDVLPFIVRFSSWDGLIQMNSHWNLYLSCDFDLDHNRAIQPFYKTIQLVMMYHQTKFGYKQTSSLDDTVESHIFIRPHSDLDLEYSGPIFLHDTSPYDNTPYRVWLKMVEQFMRPHLNKIGYTDRMTDGQSDYKNDWNKGALGVYSLRKIWRPN